MGFDTGAGLDMNLGDPFGETFGSMFSLLPSLFGGLGDFFPDTQPVGSGRRTLQLAPAPDQPYYETESLVSEAEGQALRRECRHNALEVRLREAIEAENFEEAARLRDELKRLDTE